MPGWTKGPWEVRGCELIGDGTILATIHWHSGREVQNEADKPLIAAAPAMAEALEKAAATFEFISSVAWDGDRITIGGEAFGAAEAIRSALAQARGEPGDKP